MKITIVKNRQETLYADWQIWECGVSKFDWEYTQEEHCYIIEGEVKVLGIDEEIIISKGDYVIFPKGLKCHWEVIKPIKKYYNFK